MRGCSEHILPRLYVGFYVFVEVERCVGLPVVVAAHNCAYAPPFVELPHVVGDSDNWVVGFFKDFFYPVVVADNGINGAGVGEGVGEPDVVVWHVVAGDNRAHSALYIFFCNCLANHLNALFVTKGVVVISYVAAADTDNYGIGMGKGLLQQINMAVVQRLKSANNKPCFVFHKWVKKHD